MHRKQLLATLAAGLIAGTALATTPYATAETPLDRFYHQRLDWRPCDNPRLDQAGAQCADITVPLNYAEPQGGTITVAISRIAADPARRRGVMLSNPGGPGGPGLDFTVDIAAALTPDVRASYDLIGMDPRGVGRSTPVNCHWPPGLGLESAGAGLADYAESVATRADLALRCTSVGLDRLRQNTTRNTARDMDVIRAALGVDRISYYGTSYGTYLGSVFTQLFPERVDRIVLDSSVDPARYGPVEMMRDMGPANEAALDLWAGWTAGHNDEYRLGDTRQQVRHAVEELIRRAGEQPVRLGTYTIDAHTMPIIPYVALSDPRNYAQLASNIRQLVDAADGKPVEPAPDLKDLLSMVFDPQPQDNSAIMAIMCGDAAVPRDPSWYWRNIEQSRATQPVFGAFVNNITACAFWAPPVEPLTAVGNSVPALIVQSTGDTRTTYQNALGMHRALTASRMVTLQDVSVHQIFANFPNRCVYDAVNAYFRDGALPATDLTCRAD
ncbi:MULTISPECIES: alpha/beta fold hydrolase [unclassified Nocardia]|uniref:alpha/beta fold hydrolase n=1 Tax=unclassified Nocardia TaxID=2637762 RepID=UPI001CE3EE80|nr:MULTISPECIES: alpha/beta fold hydrolase [unclassified Nocardia]